MKIRRTVGASLPLLLSLTLTPFITAAQPPKEARVTQVVNEVKLLRGLLGSRPAAVNDQVRDGTAVRTGDESRADLTFTNQALARLGANSIFSFNEKARIDLGSGALLLYVPKNAGGATINTPTVIAAITGTTCLVESHRNSFTKLIFLEGSGCIFLKGYPGQSVRLHAGDMLIVGPDATSLPHLQKVNLRLLRRTSPLLFSSLPSERLMRAEEQKQLEKVPKGKLVDPTSQDVIH